MLRKIVSFSLLLAFASLWTACNRKEIDPQSIEGEIGAAISQKCRKAVNCSVRLSALTPFVIVRDGRVVKNEFLPTDIEKPIANEVAFSTDEIDKPVSPFSCDNSAIFQATYD
jgi:hypothetical protein